MDRCGFLQRLAPQTAWLPAAPAPARSPIPARFPRRRRGSPLYAALLLSLPARRRRSTNASDQRNPPPTSAHSSSRARSDALPVSPYIIARSPSRLRSGCRAIPYSRALSPADGAVLHCTRRFPFPRQRGGEDLPTHRTSAILRQPALILPAAHAPTHFPFLRTSSPVPPAASAPARSPIPARFPRRRRGSPLYAALPLSLPAQRRRSTDASDQRNPPPLAAPPVVGKGLNDSGRSRRPFSPTPRKTERWLLAALSLAAPPVVGKGFSDSGHSHELIRATRKAEVSAQTSAPARSVSRRGAGLSRGGVSPRESAVALTAAGRRAPGACRARCSRT